MRISPDKLNKLAHTVADTLAEIDEVGFMEDRNTIRQEARKALTALLTQEAGIDTAARTKIASQRKVILEGSQEWEILYRKYYNDEVRKLGICARRLGPAMLLAAARILVRLIKWPVTAAPATQVALSSRG